MDTTERSINNIAYKFSELNRKKGCSKVDLRLTDVVELEPNTSYHLILSYTKGGKQPDLDDVSGYIKYNFNDMLTPVTATARIHSGKGDSDGVSIVCDVKKLKRNLSDTKNRSEFIPVIAGTSYMDTQIGDVWSVKMNEDTGKKYLECSVKEDIGKMLGDKVTASTRFSKGLTFGSETCAGCCCPEVGDTIKFFSDGAQREGTVVSIFGDTLHVAELDGNTYVVNKMSVVDIVKKNKKSVQNTDNELFSFYAKFLGVDMAKELFPKANLKVKKN